MLFWHISHQGKKKMTIPNESKITIPLWHYLSLIKQSQNRLLTNYPFSLIGEEDHRAIQDSKNWELSCHIVELSDDERSELKTSGLNINEQSRFYKLYTQDTWEKEERKMARQKEIDNIQRQMINLRMERINKAVRDVMRLGGMDFTSAKFMIEDCILKGMDQGNLAKHLGIEDLVEKK